MNMSDEKRAARDGVYVSWDPFDVCLFDKDEIVPEHLTNAKLFRVPALLAIGTAPISGAILAIAFPLLVILSWTLNMLTLTRNGTLQSVVIPVVGGALKGLAFILLFPIVCAFTLLFSKQK
jgi:hypothetical protein